MPATAMATTGPWIDATSAAPCSHTTHFPSRCEISGTGPLQPTELLDWQLLLPKGELGLELLAGSAAHSACPWSPLKLRIYATEMIVRGRFWRVWIQNGIARAGETQLLPAPRGPPFGRSPWALLLPALRGLSAEESGYYY